MGIVTINGRKYDSVSGLQIDEPARESVEIQVQESPIMEVAPKPRRQSKQERLAEAIAQEFSDSKLGAAIAQEIVAEPVVHEVPEWLNQFAEIQAKPATQPAWINNYVSGGDPVEIQPIGLEAAALETNEQQIEATTEPTRVIPQHNRRHAPQHSRTLNRNFVQRPSHATHVSVTHRTVAPVATHPDVHRFATEVTDFEPIASSSIDSKAEDSFTPVRTHNMEEKLAQREVSRTTQTSSDLKNVLISEQMSQPIEHKSRSKAEKKASRTRRRFTAPTLVTAALAVLVLGGYFTYVSMPSISVRVAAARAGVDAHAPYTPNGYSIDGPVAYAPGRVTIKYKANGGGDGYSLTQQTNTWGRSVIVDNLIESDSYSTLETGKVTIYRYGDKAAWVDKDILFNLSGNESLGDDHITRIVASL